MVDARNAGELLAARHEGAGVEADPSASLVNHAESPRTADWTMRSAMTRLAQPEPALVEALATLIRRLDAILHHLARPLERHTVICDRALDLETITGEPVDPYPDTRTADLARLMLAAGDDEASVLDGYLARVDVSDEERHAIPLLGVAARFDRLAEALVAWAIAAPAPPPREEILAAVDAIQARLDELGVPVEEGPPPRGRRRGSGT